MSCESDPAGVALVAVIDDDPGMRASIADLLASVGYEVACYASTAAFLEDEAFRSPACLVSDVRLPGESGLDVQVELLRRGTRLPIIFVSGFGDIQMSVQAMKGGALDFLEKPFRDQDLLDAVAIGVQNSAEHQARRQQTAGLRARYADLTPREREVLQQVALGQVNKQIAFTLGLSEITVKIHRASALRKLGATSLAEAVRMVEEISRDL